jgi:hypothetical protein
MSLMSVTLAMAFWWRDVIAEGKLNLNKQNTVFLFIMCPL